jgi:ubiquitin C-terminal hydrolase
LYILQRISGDELTYELYAVVVHTGAIGGGHYYAYVNTSRPHDVSKWQSFLSRSTGNLEELKLEVENTLKYKYHFEYDKRFNDRCEVKDNWFYISDEHVRKANINEVISHKDAYILFYEVL